MPRNSVCNEKPTFYKGNTLMFTKGQKYIMTEIKYLFI